MRKRPPTANFVARVGKPGRYGQGGRGGFGLNLRVRASLFGKLLGDLGIDGTAHGMLSSIRDWCTETTVVREVTEVAHAHKVRSRAEAAYARSDLLDRGREVMDDWAKYIASNGGPCAGAAGLVAT